MNTGNLITDGRGDQDWQEAGMWFGVDLGAVFFIDDIFLYAFSADEGMLGFLTSGLSGSGHKILYSEGQRSLQTALPVPEAFDYIELLTHDGPRWDRLAYIRYMFKPRKMRYLFWRALHIDGFWWSTKWAELMLFSPGYPAKVMLESDFINLGKEAGDDRPKVIRSLSWDADLPLDTKLQLRSRSGNTMGEAYTFYDKKGEVVTEEKWNSLPKIVRGKIDTTVVVSEDWGEWSNVYQFSGETFQSESPRRFVQLEMVLSTEDPEVAPVVNALVIEYEDALVQEARGNILPRQVTPNTDTRFTYTLWPAADAQDSGFDVIRLVVPGSVDVEDVEVQVGEETVASVDLSTLEDSLLMRLPEIVENDSVRIRFTTRVLENATVFSLDLGDSERPGLWQSVEPTERRSNIVMLPELADSGELIGNLEITPPVFTPNGDGVNDQAEIRFVVFKMNAVEPRVKIYDLSGREVVELEQHFTSTARRFTWSGRDAAGELVEPGIYLCRIDLDAQTGKDTALRTLVVAY